MGRLRTEITSQFTRDEKPVDFGTLAVMKYLNAYMCALSLQFSMRSSFGTCGSVLTLRLYSPVTSGSQIWQVPDDFRDQMVGSRRV